MSGGQKWYYMHTLNGRPEFFDGSRVCYAGQGGFVRIRQSLCLSLGQIRKEQKASRRSRLRDGSSADTGSFRHNYTRMVLPDA